MPAGGEPQAVAFYEGLLELPAVPKPVELQNRGGCWFERGQVRIHLGIEEAFRAARKAHPAFMVDDLRALRGRLENAGVQVRAAETLDGMERAHIDDPFGNRIELIGAP